MLFLAAPFLKVHVLLHRTGCYPFLKVHVLLHRTGCYPFLKVHVLLHRTGCYPFLKVHVLLHRTGCYPFLKVHVLLHRTGCYPFLKVHVLLHRTGCYPFPHDNNICLPIASLMELFEQWLYMEASRYELVKNNFSFIKIYLVTDGKLARCFLPPIGSQREGVTDCVYVHHCYQIWVNYNHSFND